MEGDRISGDSLLWSEIKASWLASYLQTLTSALHFRYNCNICNGKLFGKDNFTVSPLLQNVFIYCLQQRLPMYVESKAYPLASTSHLHVGLSLYPTIHAAGLSAQLTAVLCVFSSGSLAAALRYKLSVTGKFALWISSRDLQRLRGSAGIKWSRTKNHHEKTLWTLGFH